VGSTEAVLLDVVAVGGSVSSARRKKPSPVVHSRTVTVSVLAVTSVILTLSMSDLTPGGGSQTSVGCVDWTGDQCAGLQRFMSGDPTSSSDVVAVFPATVFRRTVPDSLVPVFRRSRFGPGRSLTRLFLNLSRRADDDDDDAAGWRAERVVLECWRALYVAASSSTDCDTVEPPTFPPGLSSSSSSSSSSLVSSEDTENAVGDTEASSVSLDSVDSGSGRRDRDPRPAAAADRRLLSVGELLRRPCASTDSRKLNRLTV